MQAPRLPLIFPTCHRYLRCLFLYTQGRGPTRATTFCFPPYASLTASRKTLGSRGTSHTTLISTPLSDQELVLGL